MLADFHKLVNGAHASQYRPVAHFHMAGNLSVVTHDAIVADKHIVCQVAIGHDQAVSAHLGLSPVFGTAVDGNKFADGGIVAYFYNRFFAFKF